MRKIIFCFTIFTLSFFCINSEAQILYSGNNCIYYHQDNCPIPDFSFYYNGQSKSAKFKLGQTSELRVVVYEGEDYFISVCAPKKWSPIHFRILEDNKERTLLFDNAKQGFVDSVKFSNEITKGLIIEVSTPAFDEEDEKADPEETKCVGVLIASRRTKQTEFESNEDTGF